MRPSFAKLPQPFIVGVVRESDPQNAICTIKNSEYDGADAYDLHVNVLEKKHRNPGGLTSIIKSTAKPVLLLNYRDDPEMTDEDRLEEQKMGLRVGAAGIDMIADLYDPQPVLSPAELTKYSLNRNSKPKEISMKPEIIARQKETIEQIHAMGAEVLLSAHTRVVLNTEQVIPIALEMQSRGPDIVKIVTICLNEDDLLEAFRTIVELKKVMKIPFQFQSHGQWGNLLRVVGPMLGSALVFCNQHYKPGTHPAQPLVRSMRSVFQNVNWSITQTDPGDSLNFT